MRFKKILSEALDKWDYDVNERRFEKAKMLHDAIIKKYKDYPIIRDNDMFEGALNDINHLISTDIYDMDDAQHY